MRQRNGMRTGVVLAAGLGSRLAQTWNCRQSKPLVAVDGKALLLRTLTSLELACNRVVIVLGYCAEEIRAYIENRYQGPLPLVFTVNPDYHLANGLSVLAARKHIADAFLLCMADHIMGDELLEIARECEPPPQGAALLVDYKIQTIFDIDDATKVLAVGDRIQRIGKQLSRYNCIDTGLFVCTPYLLEALARVHAEKGDASLSDGIQALCAAGTMQAVDIGDGFWQDVDNAEMLRHAEKQLAIRRQSLAMAD